MNDFLALDLSAAGMRAQRIRMQTVAENLANQNTIGPGGPYQRKDVIFSAVPVQSFEQSLDSAVSRLSETENGAPVQTVAVSGVRPDGAEPIKRYEPDNPLADAQGYVAYPNISIFREMTDMVEAARSYEANLAASKATQEMLISAMELVRK